MKIVLLDKNNQNRLHVVIGWKQIYEDYSTIFHSEKIAHQGRLSIAVNIFHRMWSFCDVSTFYQEAIF